MWKTHGVGEKSVSAVVGKYKGKGQLGRLRLRREDNIKMELKHDLKLSPCFESKCMYSFGYFPGV